MNTINFQCPDGKTILPEHCLIKCRMEGRCLPPPLLRRLIPHTKDPKRFAVTEIASPMRQVYLKRMCDYLITPQECKRMLFGSGVHKLCEQWDIAITEEYLTANLNGFTIVGIPDFYIMNGEEIWSKIKDETLGDYKITSPGYIAVLKQKGVPIEYKIQGNLNAWLLEEKGFKTENILFWVMTDETEGEHQELKMLIPKMPKEELISFVNQWATELYGYLESKTIPPVCEDRWTDDKRCLNYCVVNEHCPYYQELQLN